MQSFMSSGTGPALVAGRSPRLGSKAAFIVRCTLAAAYLRMFSIDRSFFSLLSGWPDAARSPGPSEG